MTNEEAHVENMVEHHLGTRQSPHAKLQGLPMGVNYANPDSVSHVSWNLETFRPFHHAPWDDVNSIWTWADLNLQYVVYQLQKLVLSNSPSAILDCIASISPFFLSVTSRGGIPISPSFPNAPMYAQGSGNLGTLSPTPTVSCTLSPTLPSTLSPTCLPDVSICRPVVFFLFPTTPAVSTGVLSTSQLPSLSPSICHLPHSAVPRRSSFPRPSTSARLRRVLNHALRGKVCRKMGGYYPIYGHLQTIGNSCGPKATQVCTLSAAKLHIIGLPRLVRARRCVQFACSLSAVCVWFVSICFDLFRLWPSQSQLHRWAVEVVDSTQWYVRDEAISISSRRWLCKQVTEKKMGTTQHTLNVWKPQMWYAVACVFSDVFPAGQYVCRKGNANVWRRVGGCSSKSRLSRCCLVARLAFEILACLAAEAPIGPSEGKCTCAQENYCIFSHLSRIEEPAMLKSNGTRMICESMQVILTWIQMGSAEISVTQHLWSRHWLWLFRWIFRQMVKVSGSNQILKQSLPRSEKKIIEGG